MLTMKGVTWITLLVIVGCSQLASTSGSQQCEAMQSVAESAATGWANALIAGNSQAHRDPPDHYCYSNHLCDEVTCVFSYVGGRLRFILLRCSNPVAFRVITDSMATGMIDRIDDYTITESMVVDFALARESRIVIDVTLEHYSNAIGLKMDLTQRVTDPTITPTSLAFIPYTRIPFDSSSGCTSVPTTGPTTGGAASENGPTDAQDSSDSAKSLLTAAIIISVISVLCMVVIALATIMAVVLLVRKKLNRSYGGRAQLAFQPLLTAPSDADEESA